MYSLFFLLKEMFCVNVLKTNNLNSFTRNHEYYRFHNFNYLLKKVHLLRRNHHIHFYVKSCGI